MTLMMQATKASIISIIGAPFLKFDVFRHPPNLQKKVLGPRWALEASFQNGPCS